jgi:cytochrome c-type biogenesis protein CcmH
VTTFAIAAVVFIALAIIAYWCGVAASKADREAIHSLREILLLRSAGKLSAEEFDLRQAALHTLLTGTAWQSRNRFINFIPPVMVSIVAAGLYAGSSQPVLDVPVSKVTTATSAPTQPATTAMADRPGGDIEQMTRRLAERLKREPGDGPGWTLLARAYLELRQYREAEEAFAQAAKILPPDATLLAEWATARVSAQSGKWDKTTLDLIARALASDPKHSKALSLAGKAAYAREDFAQATVYWKRMKETAAPDSMEAKEADAGIIEARARMSGKSGPDATSMSRIETTK